MPHFTALKNQKDIEGVQSNGIIFCLYQKGRDVPEGVNITYPYIILSLNLSGTSHSLYDMRDIKSKKNDLTVFLPGHIITPLEHSEDYAHAWLLFDPTKFNDSELKFNDKDLEFITQAPICHLSEEQALSMMSILGTINYIASRTEEELPTKHSLLEAQLSIAYNLYLSIRRECDRQWKHDRIGLLYMRFCDLVVANYKKERNIIFYAQKLGYDSRYFSKIFKEYNNGISPLLWIKQYVVTQAQRTLEEQPNTSVKEIALQLGFPTTANFCRYFKQVTGLSPKEYQEKNLQ